MTALDLAGNTPLVRVYQKDDVSIFAKVEALNPTGSIKDRIAKHMVERAEATGRLEHGAGIIEASSGNTGISLAMVGAVKGYDVTIVMPESMSVERRRMIKAYGAELVLTPAKDYTDKAIEVAERIAEERGLLFINQFSNGDNVAAHYETTGAEIAKDLNPTHLVAGIGTGGTIMGVGKRLKESNQRLKIIGVEPADSIQGLKNTQRHQRPEILDPSFVDETIRVRNRDAVDESRRIARTTGLFAGPSSGAAMLASLRVAKRSDNATIVTIFPDSGMRYLSNLE